MTETAPADESVEGDDELAPVEPPVAAPAEAPAPNRRRPDPWAAAVVAVSAFLHLWQLGKRPLAHDEAIDAWFSWQAHTTNLIAYDPVYHGPLRFYLEGFVLGHFGTTPAWARAVAALAGIAATIVIVSQRRLLGRRGAVIAAALFTISPTVLTVTRTGREDSLVGLVSLGLVLVVAHALIEPKPRHVIGAGALVAVSFTLKETTFILGFAGACFVVAIALIAWRSPGGSARRFFSRMRTLGTLPWMWFTIVFVAITMVVFTAGFRYGSGFGSGLIDGIKYWLSQHKVARGGQHWYFYGTIYLGYEWLLLAVAAVGTVVAVRRRSIVGGWFVTTAVVQFAVYSWAGEKFAWLALHPLIPAVLLAGLGGQAIADRAGTANAARWRRLAPLVVGAAAAALTTVVAIRPAITDGADTRELLVTVQTQPAVPELTDAMAAARKDGRLGAILVDERDSGSWPWAWYLHSFDKVAWVTIDPTQPLPTGYDAYIVSASTDPPTVPAGYAIERFALRGWWLPDYGTAGVGDFARWFVTRRAWSGRGSSDQYLIARTTTGLVSGGAD